MTAPVRLAQLYLDAGQYGRSWAVVHRAQPAGRYVDPELLARLQKASGKAR